MHSRTFVTLLEGSGIGSGARAEFPVGYVAKQSVALSVLVCNIALVR